MDLQKRIDEFNNGLTELMAKHQFGLSTETRVEKGLIVSKVIVVDQKPAEDPKPSAEEETCTCVKPDACNLCSKEVEVKPKKDDKPKGK